MAKYIIDFDAWTIVEAEDLDLAYAMAQDIISEMKRQLPVYTELKYPIEMVVRDDGIEESE